MSPPTHTLTPRATDSAPTSELGTFEVVRRLPVTTWSLRPAPSPPLLASTPRESEALLAIGQLVGWLAAVPWSCDVQARFAARYSLPDPLPPVRNTSAWLGVSSDAHGGLAVVPPPPAWLASILKGWSESVFNDSTDHSPTLSLRRASWTIWLFGLAQPYSNASSFIAHAHAARIIADATKLPVSLLAGSARSDERRTALSRSLANALDARHFEAWHYAWLEELTREARDVFDSLCRIALVREQLIAAAHEMRAPKNCLELAHSLVASPRLSVAEAAQRMDITFRAAQAIVDKFVAEGFLRETTGRKRDRIYLCDALSDEALLPLNELPG